VGGYFRTACNLRHARLQLLEWRHELALRCETPSSGKPPVLTRDVLLYLQLEQEHLQTLPGTTQRLAQQIEMFPALRENSPSFKYLQGHSSMLRWTIACPWHGLTTTLRLHSSTMLGACLPQPHGAIYSQRRASGSWRSDDTVTM
jgi:hypothetical protein